MTYRIVVLVGDVVIIHKQQKAMGDLGGYRICWNQVKRIDDMEVGHIWTSGVPIGDDPADLAVCAEMVKAAGRIEQTRRTRG